MVIQIGPHYKTTARSPKNFAGIVILPGILFKCRKYAAAAEKVAPFIHEATCGSGIFKIRSVAIVPDFGLAGSHVRIGLHSRMKRLKPVVGYFKVGTKQDVVFRLD